jgi:hypothetical protein
MKTPYMKKAMLVDTIFDKPLLEKKKKHGRKPKDTNKIKRFFRIFFSNLNLNHCILDEKTKLEMNGRVE